MGVDLDCMFTSQGLPLFFPRHSQIIDAFSLSQSPPHRPLRDAAPASCLVNFIALRAEARGGHEGAPAQGLTVGGTLGLKILVFQPLDMGHSCTPKIRLVYIGIMWEFLWAEASKQQS